MWSRLACLLVVPVALLAALEVVLQLPADNKVVVVLLLLLR